VNTFEIMIKQSSEFFEYFSSNIGKMIKVKILEAKEVDAEVANVFIDEFDNTYIQVCLKFSDQELKNIISFGYSETTDSCSMAVANDFDKKPCTE